MNMHHQKPLGCMNFTCWTNSNFIALCPTTGAQSKSSAILFFTASLVPENWFGCLQHDQIICGFHFLSSLIHTLSASLVAALFRGFQVVKLWMFVGEVPYFSRSSLQASFREDRRRFSVIGHRLASCIARRETTCNDWHTVSTRMMAWIRSYTIVARAGIYLWISYL